MCKGVCVIVMRCGCNRCLGGVGRDLPPNLQQGVGFG